MNREADPGLIFFQNNNGVTVIYAHAREIEIEEGQQVKAGEVVGKVGNNGNSRLPHIHVGAWKDETPLQIQVDLYAQKRYQKEEE
jgi:murein DD-endopeptidase MepM/ murein hydrolase activator NlpD